MSCAVETSLKKASKNFNLFRQLLEKDGKMLKNTLIWYQKQKFKADWYGHNSISKNDTFLKISSLKFCKI